MMSRWHSELFITAEPTPDQIQYLEDRLYEFNQGLGTRLLAAAEHEARLRGCRQILLMTFTFQAPAFYSTHGFEVIAVVDDHPRGHKNLRMRKRLGDPI